MCSRETGFYSGSGYTTTFKTVLAASSSGARYKREVRRVKCMRVVCLVCLLNHSSFTINICNGPSFENDRQCYAPAFPNFYLSRTSS